MFAWLPIPKPMFGGARGEFDRANNNSSSSSQSRQGVPKVAGYKLIKRSNFGREASSIALKMMLTLHKNEAPY